MDKRLFDRQVADVWPGTSSWWVQEAVRAYRAGRFRLILGRGDKDVYLARFWLVKPPAGEEDGAPESANSVMIHFFPRGDDDPSLHDHPWAFWTTILSGGYEEHLPPEDWTGADGLGPDWQARKVVRLAGDTIGHRATDLHCVGRVFPNTWSLVRTGPRVRTWGFHPPGEPWVGYAEYLTARRAAAKAVKA